MERRSPGSRWARTIHRRCELADGTQGRAPKARRRAAGLAVRAPCPQAASRAWRCGVPEVPGRSVTPNRQLPFRARYQFARSASRLRTAGVAIYREAKSKTDADRIQSRLEFRGATESCVAKFLLSKESLICQELTRFGRTHR